MRRRASDPLSEMSGGKEPDLWEETAIREAVRELHTGEGRFEVLHQKGTHYVVRYHPANGYSVVVKLWSQPGLTQWVRRILGIRSIDYEWRNLGRAQELGMPVPRPLGRCSGGFDPAGYTDAIVLEDLGDCVPALNHIKFLIASGEEEHLREFEDEIISLTFEMASNELFDTDHGVQNISVCGTSKPVSLDLEMARYSRFPLRRRRLYGRMLGRLLLTYTFSVQPDVERTLRFADRLKEKLNPPRAVMKLANAYLQRNMANQAKNPALDFEVPLNWWPAIERTAQQWRRKLSQREIQLIEARVAGMLAERGYELSGYPIVSVSRARKLAIAAHNRWGHMRFRQRRYGVALWLESFWAGRIPGVPRWRKRVKQPDRRTPLTVARPAPTCTR